MSSSQGRLAATARILETLTTELRDNLTAQREAIDHTAVRLHQIYSTLEALPSVLERANEIVRAASIGELLDTAAMAERVRVSQRTLREMARSGRVPAYQLTDGGDWRFDPSEVIQAIKRAGAQAPRLETTIYDHA